MLQALNVRLDSTDQPDWRFSAGPSTMALQCDAQMRTTLARGQQLFKTWNNPLDGLTWLTSNLDVGGPHSRWLGFLSYELGRLFEDLPSVARDDLHLPLYCFSLHDRTDCPPAAITPHPDSRVISSSFSRHAYLDTVRRALEFIAAGDIFQVNLSQRFTADFSGDVTSLYQKLLETAPARYGALLDYGDFALVSNSPELFLRVAPASHAAKRRVLTRPIKGTRPRAPGMHTALLRSNKDAAELNMIIDLERNDLGRVCDVGSVTVAQPRSIETHPTVYHGVATVEGTLRDNVTLVDLLRATFPGGSVTGAPKIRAMQIIDELEPVRRGPYCGAIGYLAPDGRIEFNVAIRTIILKDGLAHIPVGGGVVADSDPLAEYEETLVKAAAMLHALGAIRKTGSENFTIPRTARLG